jgi:hypothetical protein
MPRRDVTHMIVSNENEVEDGYLLALKAIEGNRG